MVKKLLLLLLCASSQYGALDAIFSEFDAAVVTDTQQIIIEGYPDAFNPSLAKLDKGFVLTFRHCPDSYSQPWLSDIGIVLLDEELNPVTAPQILNTRAKRSKTPSQAEDARLAKLKH